MQNQADLDSLLAQLRSTQDHVVASLALEARPPPPPPIHSHTLALDPSSSSSSSYPSISATPSGPSNPLQAPPPPPPPPPVQKDRSRLTFPESLPILRSIAMNEPSTLIHLQTLRKEQHAMERKMFRERKEWEVLGKRKGINEPGMVARMRLFDRSLLQRWRKYQLQQQAKLVEVSIPVRRASIIFIRPLPTPDRLQTCGHQLGIPCFSVGTDDAKALVKMERVMNVIVGMLDDQEEEEKESQPERAGDQSD
ncbi:BQ2448_7262 [Microbotryum intermedium]|uniref:BQ2448_7262 protein n=1 Tax=Microbotryum intermedium TaxID=269621 RepID=A0A238FQG5_9BASI|nr:BQ2448_7262 [Microbotryum intermedium]